MTKEQAIKKLKALQKSNNPETAHADGDEVLCAFLESIGYGDVAQEWLEITPKWYA